MSAQPRWSITRPLFLLGLLLWLAITLPSLTRYPTPHADESWISQPALSFLMRGQFGLINTVDFYGSSVSFVHSGRVLAVVLAGVYQGLGLGLWQGRLLSVFGALVGSAVLFRLAGQWFGRWAGLMGALLYLFHWRVLYAGHFIRPEVWVIAAGLGLIGLLWQLRTRRARAAYFWLALLTMAAMDIYASVVLYAVPIGALVVALNWRRADWAAIGWFALGGVLGTAGYVAIHSWPMGPTVALKQWQALSTALFDFAPRSQVPVVGPLLDYVGAYLSSTRLGGLELAYVLAGVGLLLWRRNPLDRYLLGVSGLFFATLGLLASGLNFTHMVNITPFFVLLTVGGLAVLAERIPGRLPIGAGLVLPLLGAFVLVTGVFSWRGAHDTTQENYAAQLRALLPAEGHIWGDPALWFNFTDYAFTDEVALNFLPPVASAAEARTVLEGVIAERRISLLMLKVPLPGTAFAQANGAYWDGLLAYAEAHCRLRGEVSGRAANFEVGFDPSYTTRVYVCGGVP